MSPWDLIKLTGDSNCKIEIEADQRLHVGVDSLTADYAEAHSVLLEQREDFLQKIGFVQSDGLPEESAFMALVFSG